MPNTIEQQEIIDKVKGFRSDGVNAADLFDRMRKAEDFKVGKQWDPDVKARNERKGKFCLTIPLIKPIIKQISGIEIENPRDIIVKNVKNGTKTGAKILNSLVKQITDSEMTRFELSHAFEAGVGNGQGVIGIFIDKRKDPKHANLSVRKLVEHNVLFDPTCLTYNINKPDSGCKYAIWEEWTDKDYINEVYPDLKNELTASSISASTFGAMVIGNVKAIINNLVRGGSKADDSGLVSTFTDSGSDGNNVVSKSKYCVNHTWWRRPKTCIWWYDNRESEMNAKLLIDDKKIAAAKKATKEEEENAKQRKVQAELDAIAEGVDIDDPEVKAKINKAGEPFFEVFPVVVNVVHHTIRIGNVFLEDRVDELNGVDAIPILPYWAYFDNGYISGITEDLIGTQQELNYIHSQNLNITKNIANSGYIIDGGANTEAYKLFLEAHGGEDGIVLDKAKAGGNIQKISPAGIPSAHAMFENNAKENMRLISNQRTEMPTRDDQALSGKAIALKQKASLQGAGSIFLNWNYTFMMFANVLVNVIRANDIFSEDEIFETVEKEDMIDNAMFARAREIVIETLQSQGVEIPEPPKQPNLMMIRNLDPKQQQIVISGIQKEMEAYKSVQQQIDAQAEPFARAMLLDEIKNLKRGEYSCVVTLSAMSDTMRAIKAAEIFELNKVLIESGDVPIDGEMLIDATDIDNKDLIKERRKEKLQSMAAANSEDQNQPKKKVS